MKRAHGDSDILMIVGKTSSSFLRDLKGKIYVSSEAKKQWIFFFEKPPSGGFRKIYDIVFLNGEDCSFTCGELVARLKNGPITQRV